MSVVGLDLGLQNSVIAAAGRGGVDVILNGNSNRLNPTMVNFDESRKMGEQVSGSTPVSKFKTTIKYMKRLVGLAFDDPRAKKEMEKVPYQCVPITHASGGPPSIAVKVFFNGEDKILPVEQVLGMMVHHMGMVAAKKTAEESGIRGSDNIKKLIPQDWVIAIPPYYTDAQRRAVLTGCEIVGITGVQRLMHENTATALAYGIFKDIRKEFTKENPTNVMFIDMGASAYTVTIAVFEPGKLIIKSANFDEDLGGRDFDQAIANWLADKFSEKFKNKLSGDPKTKPKVMLKLLDAAEKAKKTLSPQGVKEASINLECLMDDLDFNVMLTSSEYEALCAPLLAKLEGPVQKCLEEAKLTSKDLAAVEIVGGSTRIGFVKKKLMEILNVNNLSTTMNADESVARGAALQSAILSPRFKVLPYDIEEFQPLPIKLEWDEEKGTSAEKGVEVEGDADGAELPANSVTMFPRGLNFPVVRRVTLRRAGEFSVTSSYDPSALNHGLQPGATMDIASWVIKASPGVENKVRVNVKQDINGIVTMSSAQMLEEIDEEEGDNKDEEMKDEAGEKKKKIKKTNLEWIVTRPLEWTKDEINKFFEMEVAMGNQDRVVQETSDMRNELESYIYDMRDKIMSESHLGSYSNQQEKDAFNKKNEEVENWLYADGFDAVKSTYASKLEELKKLGGPIEYRAAEAEARPSAISALQQNVEKFKKWLADAQGNDSFAHILDEEFSKCHAKCDEVSGWMYDKLDEQSSLPPHVDPAFTVADVNAKSKELTNVCGPIMHKPKPKPPKVEAKPAEEEKAAEEPAPMDTEGGEGDKMEVDEA
ncbi:molecular chaperone DnaK [Nitzschia inconspicua]|uniref:Molecular chaperone DnaK n=1 Tax=Nitzschia inconspicua TaxID=303405 RepID=A0A9K3K8M4_9STRA|nr:molecular chaperone DnaK [Nitzschia inconspicua]KAG7353189.1 molecular chaperone DnaK [Nitzschia inconspicua]